jgi:periplasmic protein TonB
VTALAPAPSPTRPRFSSQAHRRRLWGAAVLALAAHAVIYFSGKPALLTDVEFGMEEPPASVDVDLVESAPPPPAEPPQPEPPQPEPPQPEPPKPEPVPEPEPPKPKEEIISLPAEPKPKPVPRPATPPRASVAPVPAKPATTRPVTGTAAATGAPTGTKAGITSGPGHLYNPKPAYPAESRAAKEQGTVLLSVAVDAAGRPTGVSVAKSSGFPRLDRSAQEGVQRWRFKPALRNGVPQASSVIVPVRFMLPR